MTGLLSGIRSLNDLGNRGIAEPFAGGAGASLSLLFREDAPDIHINDADPAIHDFWWTLVNRPQPFLDMLSNTQISMPEWRRQRDTYRYAGRQSRLRRGFSAFYLNRCNHSGIIMNGGPIGGIKQEGKWKLNARFSKPGLLRRCMRVSEYSDRIHVSCREGIEFIADLDHRSTFFFIDPPYFVKGQTLYLNALDRAYHEALAAQLATMPEAAWILTYDDCPEIRQMYAGWSQIRPFSLRYAASRRREGREILIAPQWIQLPATQQSAALTW